RRTKRRKPFVEASAGVVAAVSVERRAGAKGNTHQQSTCRAQNRVSVSKALERIRPLVPSHTRGWSRMRESRTYGSGRGACDETHVPTATTPPRVHHANRRRGGRVAAGGKGAAVENAFVWVSRRCRPSWICSPNRGPAARASGLRLH